jgi:uncharacterized membrane protein
MSNMIVHLVIWAIMATVVVFLALYRRRIYMKSDEILHLPDAEASMVSTQESVGKQLERIDRWGKLLTVLVVLYALAIAGMYFYRMFTDTSIKMS